MRRSLLFLISAAAFAGALFTQIFPLLSFVAIAPMLSLMDSSQEEEENAEMPVLEHTEWILAALAIGFVLRSVFQSDAIFHAAVWSVSFAFVFVMFGIVRRQLGKLTGVLPLALFWLALEYIFLKLQWPGNGWFLADLLSKRPEWTAWMASQGYLAASVWLLVTNLLAWGAFFRGKVNVPMLMAFIAAVGVPIILSYMQAPFDNAISRGEMMSYYAGETSPAGDYGQRGEWLGRTSAWVSVLVLLFAFVRRKTNKKK